MIEVKSKCYQIRHFLYMPNNDIFNYIVYELIGCLQSQCQYNKHHRSFGHNSDCDAYLSLPLLFKDKSKEITL